MTTVWVSDAETQAPEGLEQVQDAAEADLWLLGGDLARAVTQSAQAAPHQVVFRVQPTPSAEALEHLGSAFDDLVSTEASAAELLARLRSQRDGRTTRARAEMLRALAHDLNNPLTAIRLLSDVIRQEITDEECREDMASIIQAADAAAMLVESLRAYARRYATPGIQATVDVSAVLAELVRRPSLRDKITLTTGGRPCQVQGDPAALTQALTDLVVNARRLCTKGQACQIGVVTRDEHVVISTRSTVKTMPAGVDRLTRDLGAKTLREQHFQVLPTGLFHARETAEGLGGSLSVAAEGGLVRMRMSLPIGDE